MKSISVNAARGAAVLLAALLAAGCASKGGTVVDGGRGSVAPMPLTTLHEAVAVVYRKPETAGVPALILVNDQVAGSLRPGAYTQTVVCPGDRIGTMPATGDKKQPASHQTVTTPGGGTVYLQVSQAPSGDMLTTVVDPVQARQDLAGEWRQSYLVSRYVPQCQPVKVAAPVAPSPEPVPAPVVIERVQLEADALFAFGRAQLEDIQPAGRAALENLVKRIREQGVRVESLRIVGHADRLGSPPANQQLSLARALTVQQFLQQSGLNIAMDTQGKGSSEPITQDCKGPSATPALVACLQPDRRVEVELMGEAPGVSAR